MFSILFNFLKLDVIIWLTTDFLLKSHCIVSETILLHKVFFIILISTTVLFIPGLNLFFPLITAFFLGWELYDLTLARRGFTFKERLNHIIANVWSILGLGVWQLIPGVQFLLMPLAVPGATILAIENLDQQNQKEAQ